MAKGYKDVIVDKIRGAVERGVIWLGGRPPAGPPDEQELLEAAIAFEGGTMYEDGWGAWSDPKGHEVPDGSAKLPWAEVEPLLFDTGVRLIPDAHIEMCYAGHPEKWMGRLVEGEEVLTYAFGNDPDEVIAFLAGLTPAVRTNK